MWLLKISLDILGNIAAFFLAPFVVLAADKFTGRLPRPFWWMETPDVRLPGDMAEKAVFSLYKRFGWYLTSLYWVGWRNRAYGLSSALAFKPDRGMPMKWWGLRDISDDGPNRGWAFFRIGPAWEFYAVLGRKLGLRVRVGYKLQPFFQNDDWSNPLWGMPVLHISLRKLG